jgi:hypothetical protein
VLVAMNDDPTLTSPSFAVCAEMLFKATGTIIICLSIPVITQDRHGYHHASGSSL